MIDRRRQRAGAASAAPHRARAGRPAWRTLGAVFVPLVFVPPLLLLVSGSLRRAGPAAAADARAHARTRSRPRATERAVELGGLLRATLNSLLVAAVAVPLSVLVASLAGFALTQLSRRVTAVVAGRRRWWR